MKLLLTALSILYFTGIGCGEQEGSIQNTTYSLGSLFTITHNATDVEPVYIYLYPFKTYTKTLIEGNYTVYKLQPLECLIVKKSQFSNLKIRLGEGGWGYVWWNSDDIFACGDSSKCKAGHYEILDLGEPHTATDPRTWFNNDEFNLVPAKQANQSEKCTNIEDWMEAKLRSQTSDQSQLTTDSKEE